MIKILTSKKRISEGILRQFTASDRRDYLYAENLPNGDRPYIYKGKFGDIIITGEAEAYNSPDTVSVIIYIDNGYSDGGDIYPDVYVLRDQYLDNDLLRMVGRLSKYVDSNLYSIDRAAERLGFEKIDVEKVEFIPNLGSLI